MAVACATLDTSLSDRRWKTGFKGAILDIMFLLGRKGFSFIPTLQLSNNSLFFLAGPPEKECKNHIHSDHPN